MTKRAQETIRKLHLVFQRGRTRGMKSNRIGHSDQFGQRVRIHLLHDAPAMDLDRNLGNSDFSRDLLVHKPARDQRKHFAFAFGQGLKMHLYMGQQICA